MECPTSRFLHEIEKSEFDGSVGPSEGTTSASEDEEEVSSSAEEIPEVPSTTEDSLDSITEELARYQLIVKAASGTGSI